MFFSAMVVDVVMLVAMLHFHLASKQLTGMVY